jgi:hypothetical protein
MRTAFICVTVTVTAPLERIYISAGVTRRPFGFQPKGWCLSRSRNGSAHFRRYFAMGKIRGTPYMRSHICVHRATTKYFSNSFVFKTEIEKEGLPGDITPALGAGGPRFKSGRPDQFLTLPYQPLAPRWPPFQYRRCNDYRHNASNRSDREHSRW